MKPEELELIECARHVSNLRDLVLKLEGYSAYGDATVKMRANDVNLTYGTWEMSASDLLSQARNWYEDAKADLIKAAYWIDREKAVAPAPPPLPDASDKCAMCDSTGLVTDTEGQVWPCPNRCPEK